MLTNQLGVCHASPTPQTHARRTPSVCRVSQGRGSGHASSKTGKELWNDIWSETTSSTPSTSTAGSNASTGDDRGQASHLLHKNGQHEGEEQPTMTNTDLHSSEQRAATDMFESVHLGSSISSKALPQHEDLWEHIAGHDNDEEADETHQAEEVDGASFDDKGSRQAGSHGESFDAHDGHFNGKFMKLVPLEGGEATLEINGVKMHITASKSPLQDAKDKVRFARVRKNSVVLDVCTGLGYSAIACARAGAKEVYTIELEPDVLEAARQNPASSELFNNAHIRSLQGSAFEVIQTFPDEMFHAALHDPPRLTHAGELYSLQFYQQLFRVMRSGARLFHYTGSPRGVSSKSIPKGIKERLGKAGFVEVKWQDTCQGFSATKP